MSGGGLTIDLVQAINDSRIGAFRLRVFTLCFLVSMLDGFDTQVIAFVAPAISEAWGLSPARFGPILSAGLFGSVIGALIAGRLADRFGRKKIMIVAIAWFGTMTIMCGLAVDATELLVYRFLAGIGLGGAIPCFLALTSEYSSDRWRTTSVAVIIWGFPLGAVVGGLFSPHVITHFGWATVFFIGGTVPLVLLPLIWLGVPESIQFLAARGNGREQIAKIVQQIRPGEGTGTPATYHLEEPSPARIKSATLFSREYLAGTILLSCTMFMSLLMSYLLISWVPLLLRQSGLSIQSAIFGAVTLNLSGIVGSFIFSRWMDKSGQALLIMPFAYFMSAIALGITGIIGTSFLPLMASLFATGFFLIGIQLTLASYISSYYPVAIRSSGIGFIQAIGRLGSIAGPLVGGALLFLGSSPGQLFLWCMVVPVVAALSLFYLSVLTAARPVDATP